MARNWNCEIRPPLMSRGGSSWSRKVIPLLQQASIWLTMLSIHHCLPKVILETFFRRTERSCPFRVGREVLLVEWRDLMSRSLSLTPIRAGRNSLLNGNLTIRLLSGSKWVTFTSVGRITKKKDWHLFKFATLTRYSKSNQGRMGLSVSKTIRVTTSGIERKHWLGKVTAKHKNNGRL